MLHKKACVLGGQWPKPCQLQDPPPKPSQHQVAPQMPFHSCCRRTRICRACLHQGHFSVPWGDVSEGGPTPRKKRSYQFRQCWVRDVARTNLPGTLHSLQAAQPSLPRGHQDQVHCSQPPWNTKGVKPDATVKTDVTQGLLLRAQGWGLRVNSAVGLIDVRNRVHTRCHIIHSIIGLEGYRSRRLARDWFGQSLYSSWLGFSSF